MTALDDALWPRAALPRRPMLGAVLDALTVWEHDTTPPSMWLARGRTVEARATACVLHSPTGGFGWRYPWALLDVAEAYELLQARGIIPLDSRSRFVCEACGGTGSLPRDTPGGLGGWACACDNGHAPHPPTVAALASWASLGFTPSEDDDAHWSIPAAEALARSTTAEPMALWRVGVPRDGRPTGGLPQRSPGVALWRAGIPAVYEGGGVPRVTLYVPPLGLVTL